MSGDSRKEYLLTAAANIFGLNTNDSAVNASFDNAALNNFLDDGNANVLAVRQVKGKLVVSNKVRWECIMVFSIPTSFLDYLWLVRLTVVH